MESTSQISARLLKMDESVALADAHCHLDLFPNPSEAVEEARRAGVGIIVTAGSDGASNMKTLQLAKNGVYGVVGISPDFSSHESGHIDGLAEIIKMNRNIVGIGEIGLDNTVLEKAPMEKQKEAFQKQLEIAKAMELPVVVHARKALKEVMQILKDSEMDRVIFHYFEGAEAEAKEVEKEGWLVSIPPIESSRRKRVIKALDLNSIVAETDSPVVGRSPADVIGVIEKIAWLKGISSVEAGERITKTIKEYFYI